MKPFNAKMMPILYHIDNDIVRLLSEVNEKYGEYKSLLNIFKFDQKFFLNTLVLNDSIISSLIEGTQITKEEMYYIDYLKPTSNILEVKNLKDMFEYAFENVHGNDFTLYNICEMHKILLDDVRGSMKGPGVVREIQNYIGPKHLGIDGASFIPPSADEVMPLFKNLINYMNEVYGDEPFIQVALMHAQFETIHPFLDGNGRIGRALMTLELAKLKNDEPILFFSEVIELYKSNYYNVLTEFRFGKIENVIKFFLQCSIDQINRNISRINLITQIFDEDLKLIKKTIKGTTILDIHEYMVKKIVFTENDIVSNLSIHRNTATRLLNKLIELGLLEKEKKLDISRYTYKYTKIHNIFM